MKKIVLTFGGISGLIVVTMGFVTMPLLFNGTLDFTSGAFVGYTTMVIALSLIFFGVKSYRDNHLGGSITFWKASQVGALIALVASVIYAAGWEINFNFFFTDFVDQYAQACISHAQADHATPEKIAEVQEQIAQVREIYKVPILRFGMTIFEMLPIGLVIALICGALLRKKELLPA